jgi:hypothetical protein
MIEPEWEQLTRCQLLVVAQQYIRHLNYLITNSPDPKVVEKSKVQLIEISDLLKDLQ